MAFDNRRTYLCYDNSDLIRDGVIKAKIEKEYLPVDTFNVRRLRNPPKGVNYVVTRDPDTREITAIREVKKQLPASKIKIEIDFSKVMRDSVTHPIAPGTLGFNPMVNTIATPMLALLGMGGITSGLTYFTMQILDSETKINRAITVTKEMIETGIWECDDGYPLSVFGIVSSYIIPAETEEDEDRTVSGLDFDVDDPLKDPTIIGKYSDGTWKGTARKRISGATDSNGLFGSIGIPEIKFENVADPVEQPQLFVKIVRDERKLKFRGDNYDASGGKDYPFRLTGVPGVDATDKQIRIKILDDDMSPLIWEGEKIYITYSVASERHLRQNLNHRGDIAQGNTVGIVGFRGAIKSEVDAFDYQITTWKVPVLPDDIEMQNIDELNYEKEADYKLTFPEYIEIRDLEEEKPEDAAKLHDTLEGWRLSESITNGHVKMFWAADYRGILLYSVSGGTDFEEIINNIRIPHIVDGVITRSDPYIDESSGKVSIAIVYPASSIRDQDWFKDYLESLDFTYSSSQDEDGNEVYATEDLRKKIDDNVDLEREPGFLFDLTDATSSMLFDREKIPYYRPFANALKNVSKYKDDEEEDRGVGVILLDLIKVASNVEDINFELYDLSYIEFYHANAQPLKSYSCDEAFDIHAWNYPSESYDTNTLDGGMGAWYDQGHIEEDVMLWHPSGSSIESYWKLETPYFCGNYSRKSRIYTERLSGPSLDNYSWIFTDTEPFVPHNISADTQDTFDQSMVVFNDDLVHYGLCYNKFVGNSFDHHIAVTEVDNTKSHVKETYNHDADMVVGQNRLLGDASSYSNGIPIVDDVFRVCNDENGDEFWFSKEIYEDASYGLDFYDDVPTANIPTDWFIRRLTINFSIIGYDDLTEVERYVSFYFEGSESSISEVKISKGNYGADYVASASVNFKYYYNAPLQFLGEFWKKINVLNVEIRATSPNHPINPLSLDIDDYKIKSGQNSVVYDGLGRLIVFYANIDTGNIDAAISYDDGKEWIIHKSLIRLISGESTGIPFAIKDRDPDFVHLFFTLNDVFLMYKRINTDLFKQDDSLIDSKVPESYDVDDYDQTLVSTTNPPQQDWPEKVYWGEYSDYGNVLRRFPSYFIAGDATDHYFIEQRRINRELFNDYEDSPSTDTRQFSRFKFASNTSQMDDEFRGDPYSVFMDDEGVFRLFMLSDGKLTIKRSNNYFSWKYDVEDQIIHKDFVDEQANKGMTEEIQNIQVVRNNYTAGLTSVLYFHAGMLFIRHFQTDLLFPFYDSNGDMNNEDMKEHIGLTEITDSLPIFLVGKIPDNIKAARLREIDNKEDNSELFIHFPYDKETLEKFDERFEVDVDTQVYAYTTKTGLIRIFYKDSFGNLNGIILDSLKKPILEVMNKFKES